MDAVVLLELEEYIYLTTIYKGDVVGKDICHICNKVLAKVTHGDRIYFKADNKIVGYSTRADWHNIDEDEQNILNGRLWQHIGRSIVYWNRMYWYKEPIEYKKRMKLFGVRYFDLQKVLKGKREPEIKE